MLRYLAVPLVAAALVGCGTSGPSKEVRDLQATITALQHQLAETPTPAAQHVIAGTVDAPDCRGGYNLLSSPVMVRNESNTIVGTGTTDDHDSSTTVPGCTVHFTVSVGPAQFYQLQIGTHAGPSYTFDELQQANWTIALKLN